MKRIMDMVAEDGRELEVHSYLIVFLKFVQVSSPHVTVTPLITVLSPSLCSLLYLLLSMTIHNSLPLPLIHSHTPLEL